MSEDRALDRLVGERVFGFQIYHYDKGYPSECYWQLMDQDYNPVIHPWKSIYDGQRATEDQAWDDCPKYSSEWEAAHQILDHVRTLDAAGRFAFRKALHKATADRMHTALAESEVTIFMEPVDVCHAALIALPIAGELNR